MLGLGILWSGVWAQTAVKYPQSLLLEEREFRKSEDPAPCTPPGWAGTRGADLGQRGSRGVSPRRRKVRKG